MASMEPESVDAIVTDPPYGLEFMGKEWDRLGDGALASQRLSPAQIAATTPAFKMRGKSIGRQDTSMQAWHERWATAALRVAKPGAYLLAFGGTRTFHRLAVAIEDAGWIIRDTLVWAYASGFPKSKASLKPAWEPIVMARKPGPLRDLDIEGCRIATTQDERDWMRATARPNTNGAEYIGGSVTNIPATRTVNISDAGRWPANVILTDPIFDGGWDGVVGGGETSSGVPGTQRIPHANGIGEGMGMLDTESGYGDTGTYSRFFLVPKSSRSDREPISGRTCDCQTVKLGAWSTRQSRATDAAPSEDGFVWSTSSSGSEPTDPSTPASRSTTSTETRPITDSTTSDSWIPSPTNGFTQEPSYGMGDGGSPAASAASTSPSTPTGISHLKDGPSTDDAEPVISERSSKPSVCGNCGREVVISRRERVNAHPT
jgi:site-specific DNA-methyltransferase (adenine-specific)